jgi:hypothetical protein
MDLHPSSGAAKGGDLHETLTTLTVRGEERRGEERGYMANQPSQGEGEKEEKQARGCRLKTVEEGKSGKEEGQG